MKGIKSHLEKVLNSIQELKCSEKPFRTKTFEHLSELVCICNQIIDLIYSIIGYDEPDNLSCQNIDTPYQEPQTLYENPIGQVNRENLWNKKSPTQKYTPTQCASIVQEFGDALHRNANINYNSEQANMCSELLWRWFHLRYQNTYDHCKEFKYSVMDIKKYIHAIVIAFGYYYENESLDKIYTMFDKWENSIKYSEKSNRYVVPFEVAQIGKRIYHEHATLTSAIIWDMFATEGLSSIRRDDEVDGAYIDHDQLIDRLFYVNPEIADEFNLYIESMRKDEVS